MFFTDWHSIDIELADRSWISELVKDSQMECQCVPWIGAGFKDVCRLALVWSIRPSLIQNWDQIGKMHIFYVNSSSIKTLRSVSIAL